jgi:hypothetical protein
MLKKIIKTIKIQERLFGKMSLLKKIKAFIFHYKLIKNHGKRN